MVSAQEFGRASISRLINTGQIEEARATLEANDPSEADRTFFEGRVLKAQSRLPAAIGAFRHVLQIDPDYINARRELAHTLLLNRSYGAAEYHFDALLRIDRNEQMRNGYRGFLDVINQNKPYGMGGSFSIHPSTNINQGTTNTVFDSELGQFVIDSDSQAQSGVGVQLGLSGFFRQVTGASSRVSLNWNISGTKYEEARHDSAMGNTSLSYERITGTGSWVLDAYFRKTWREDDADNEARGLRFALNHRLNARNLVSFSISHEYREFEIQDYQNGPFTSAALQWHHQFTPSLSVNGGFGLETNKPDARHLQYDTRKLFLGMSNNWQGGLQTNIGLEFGQRKYVGVYPLTNYARDDDFHAFNIGVQHSRIAIRGFTPKLSCTHRINHSNVAFYDFNATECQASISRNF